MFSLERTCLQVRDVKVMIICLKKKLKNIIGLTWIRHQIFAITSHNAVSTGTYMYQATQL